MTILGYDLFFILMHLFIAVLGQCLMYLGYLLFKLGYYLKNGKKIKFKKNLSTAVDKSYLMLNKNQIQQLGDKEINECINCIEVDKQDKEKEKEALKKQANELQTLLIKIQNKISSLNGI